MLPGSGRKQNKIRVSSIYSSVYAKAHLLKYDNETPGCTPFHQVCTNNSLASFSIGEDRAAVVKAVVSEASTADCFDIV